MSTHTAYAPQERVLAKRDTLQILGIWLVVRLLTSLWAAFVSPLDPGTPRERAIALWPPSVPLDAWLERVLLAPWERWDVQYYLWIVSRGYRTDDGTAQFHPLYAWLATPLTWLGLSPLLSLLLVSSVSGALLLIVFERLARYDLPPAEARISTLLLLCSPLALALFAPYTEALFLLWCVLCFLWARQGAWWWAGAAAALATLTRQQGLFLLLPLAWELWEAAGRDWRRALAHGKDWLALACIPLALLGWIVYRALALADVTPDMSNPQALIYSVLISPSSEQVVPTQAFLWPWHAFALALDILWRTGEPSLIVDLALALPFVVLLMLAWPHMRISYRIYAAIITLVSFSYYTGPDWPYMGLLRHLFVAFPVFIGLGPVLRRRWQHLSIIILGLFAMLFLLMLYSMKGWVL